MTLSDLYRHARAQTTLEPLALNGQRRADILVEGNAAPTSGKSALDVSVVAAPAYFKTNNNQHRPNAQPISKQLQDILLLRKRRKLSENADVSFGAEFFPWIISSRGTLHEDTQLALSHLKSCLPNPHELTHYLRLMSVQLAYHRAWASLN